MSCILVLLPGHVSMDIIKNYIWIFLLTSKLVLLNSGVFLRTLMLVLMMMSMMIVAKKRTQILAI